MSRSFVWLTSSLALFAFACGAREGARAPVALDAYATSTTTGAKQPGAADPICGEHWKWDGEHCVASDAEAKTPSDLATDGGGATASTNETEAKPQKPTSLASDTNVAQLVMEDIKVGTGAEAKNGDTVRVHYVGTLLQDGSEFDSSRKRGQAFEFRLGAGMVIKGFDRGVTGMKVGGIRKLTIPPELGYGRRGVPPMIPANATLVFEIELLDVI